MGTCLSVRKGVVSLEQKTITNHSIFPFLRLPAELRIRIYELAFAGGLIRVHKVKIQTGNIHAKPTVGALSLRATCRQIRSESDSVFYQQYIFNFSRVCNFEPHDIAADFRIDNYQRIERIAVNFRLSFFIWMHMDDENPNEIHGLFPRLSHIYVHKFSDLESPSGDMARAFGRPDLELHEEEYLGEDKYFWEEEEEEEEGYEGDEEDE